MLHSHHAALDDEVALAQMALDVFLVYFFPRLFKVEDVQ